MEGHFSNFLEKGAQELQNRSLSSKLDVEAIWLYTPYNPIIVSSSHETFIVC